ncbi:MAG: S-layer homology domain-containing protein [Oscillospiraceae bacterium]|nr:S-layer homology domain-containing protein [Oscillospiraceae bacterium]
MQRQKKSLKFILAVVLAIAMVMSYIPSVAFAVDEDAADVMSEIPMATDGDEQDPAETEDDGQEEPPAEQTEEADEVTATQAPVDTEAPAETETPAESDTPEETQAAAEAEESVELKEVSANIMQVDTVAAIEPEKDENGNYLIATEANWLWFANQVNTGDTAINAILQADLSITEEDVGAWTSVGTSSYPYTGTFDGNGHSLTTYRAVFDYVSTGTVQDLTVEGSVAASATYSAVIVNRLTGAGTVLNCTNEASMTNSTNYTGGVVGYVTNASATVEGCENTGTITSTGSGTGGVVGYVTAAAKISNCVNSGEVIGGTTYTGGVCAYITAAAIVSDCSNTGEITGGTTHTGGIVGYLNGASGSITNCANTGTVIGGTIYTGGIAGDTVAPVSKSYNTGDISGTYHVGGIAGRTYNANASITECYNSGTVTGTVSNTSGGAGGIAGTVYYASAVDACYNTGDIVGGPGIAGGIIGYTYNAGPAVTNCYNIGTVTGTGTIGEVIGSARTTLTSASNNYYLKSDSAVGGIAGADVVGVAEQKSQINLQMDSMLYTLGASYVADTNGAINDGYPVLAWQTADTAPTSEITITGQPSDADYEQGDTPIALNVTATATGVLTYQWYRNTAETTSGAELVSGETTTSCTPDTSAATTWYYYVVITDGTDTVYSNFAAVAVILRTAKAPIIATQPADVSTPQNTAVTLSVTATAPNTGYDEGALSYQWYAVNADGSTTLIEEETDAEYTPTVTQTGYYYYYVVVTYTLNDTQSSVTSATVCVTVTRSDGNVARLTTDSDETGTYYTTLNAALDAANATEENTTVTVLWTSTLTAQTITGHVTLDLGGYTVTSSDATTAVTIESGGSLTLKNGDLTSSTATTLLSNSGTLSVENVQLLNSKSSGYGISNSTSGEITTITDSTICASAATSYGIATAGEIDLIQNSFIVGTNYSLTATAGTIQTIEDCTIGSQTIDAITYTSARGIHVATGAVIEELTGTEDVGTTVTGSAYCVYVEGEIDLINACTITSTGTTTSTAGLYVRGSVETVQNSTILGFYAINVYQYAASNIYGSIDEIVDSTILIKAASTAGSTGIFNTGVIGEISGSEIKIEDSATTSNSRRGFNNAGTIGAITGGSVISSRYTATNAYNNINSGTIELIDEATISGYSSAGLIDNTGGMIDEITENTIVPSSSGSAFITGGSVGIISGGSFTASYYVLTNTEVDEIRGGTFTSTSGNASYGTLYNVTVGLISGGKFTNSATSNAYVFNGSANDICLSGGYFKADTALFYGDGTYTYADGYAMTTAPIADGDYADYYAVVRVVPTITAQPTVSTLYARDAAATPLTVAFAEVGEGVTTVQWYAASSADGTWAAAAGTSDKAQYTPSTATLGTTYYKAVVTNTIGDTTYTAESDYAAVTVTATGNADAVAVAFSVTPSDAALVVIDLATGAVVSPVSGTEYSLVVGGAYQYILTRDGYRTTEETFVITDTSDMTITAQMQREATVTFSLAPATARVSLQDAQGNEISPQEDGTYCLVAGSYTYTVSADGYESYEGTLTISGDGLSRTVPVSLTQIQYWSDAGVYDSSWYNSSDTTYTISTAAQLGYLNYLGNNGTTFSGKTIQMDANLDISTYLWKPWGATGTAFAGTFDGQGYSISGLRIQSTEWLYVGFFGATSGATIKDFHIASGSVAATIPDLTSNVNSYVGAIVGSAGGGTTVTNCSNAASVYTQTTNNWENQTGGLVGQVGSGALTIYNSYNTGDVTNINNSTASSGKTYAGGLLGRASGGTATITNCYNLGDVLTNSFTGTAGNVGSGGLVGWTYQSTATTIKNCYNAGSVSSNQMAGGLVATATSVCAISNSYFQAQDGLTVAGGTGVSTTGVGSFAGQDNLALTAIDSNTVTYTDLLTALNAWVAAEGTTYESWGGTGYPVFANAAAVVVVYAVTFFDADGTKLDSQTVVEGGLATTPTEPTPGTNERFAGWYEVANSGVTYTDETLYSSAEVNARTVTKTTQYKAYFSGAQYAIMLDSALEAVSGITGTAVQYGTDAIVKLTAPDSRYDYTVTYQIGSGTAQTLTADLLGYYTIPGAEILDDIVVTVTMVAIVDAETPTITTQPLSAAYLPGETATPLTVTASVTDGGTLSYEWFSSADGSATGGTSVGTGDTYTPSTTTMGTYYYYVVVTNTNNSVNGTTTVTATSAVATVWVSQDAQTPTISAQPQSASYTKGVTAAALTVMAEVLDGGTLSYQWYSSADGSATGGTVISGATTLSYTPGTTTTGTYYYYVVVTNTNSDVNGAQTAQAVSAVATITISTSTSGGGGGSSSSSSSSSSTDTTTQTDTQTKSSEVSVAVEATVTDDGATAEVSMEVLEEAIAGLDAGGTAQITVSNAPDAGVSVFVPASGMSSLAGVSNASLEVTSSLGTVWLSAQAVSALAQKSGTTMIALERATTGYQVTVSVDGVSLQDVSGGVIVKLAETGKNTTVVYEILADGSEQLVRKSVVISGVVYALLDGSATFYLADNAKTFGDVPSTEWFADATAFVSSHELFNGVGDNVFDPNGTMTRGMLVTVLYRLENEPATNQATAFQDVTSADYFAKAVQWAAGNGIVNGVSDTMFDPNASITREQLATILYRYASTTGMDTSGTALSEYSDTGDISAYAEGAMQWAVGSGIINGRTATTLAPGEQVSRAEAATMIYRLVMLMV